VSALRRVKPAGWRHGRVGAATAVKVDAYRIEMIIGFDQRCRADTA
jgi:hypothetical protein